MQNYSTQKKVVSPKIYAVILRSMGNVNLSIGVYYSLEDAIAGAKKDFLASMGTPVGQINDVDVFLYSIMDIEKIIPYILEGALEPQALTTTTIPLGLVPTTETKNKEDIKTIKNRLMTSLITGKDPEALELAKEVLTKAEIKFVKNKLEGKKK